MKTFYLWCSTVHLHLDSLPMHNEMQMVSVLRARWDSGEKQSWFGFSVCKDSPGLQVMDSEGAVIYSPVSWAALQEEGEQASSLGSWQNLLPKHERQSHRGDSQQNQLWEEDQLQSLKQSHSRLSSDGARLTGHSKGSAPITVLGLLQCSVHTEERDNGWKKFCLFNNLYRDLILYYVALSYVMHRRKIGFPHSSMPPNPAEMVCFFFPLFA